MFGDGRQSRLVEVVEVVFRRGEKLECHNGGVRNDNMVTAMDVCEEANAM